ncbi:MAG: hypothetical protein QXX77_09385 [Candidatus Methanosuratincola sp.]
MVVSKNQRSDFDAEARSSLSAINSSRKRASEARAKAELIRKQGASVKSKSYMARAKLMEFKESLKGETSGFSGDPEKMQQSLSSILPAGPKASATSSQLRALSKRIFRKPEKS